ncbi:MAG: efflux RND transporter permease subunit [Phycisphaerae bacterium]|nr:efflux RND transporter permease subunit [Phycisphaerae bacterium]
MNLPRACVNRPITTTMITLIVIVIGAFALHRLRIDLLPSVELPTLTIRTEYRGASPEVIEQQVTQIIEEIVATVTGVKEISSTLEEGRSSVRVTFAWGTEIDEAAIDVRSTLEDELNELPEEIERPRIRKFDVASFPVVLLGVSSDMDPVELTELVEDQVRYRFGRIPGVAQVDLWGGFNREIRIEIDETKINALNIPLNLVLSAVRDANLDLPAGRIEQGRYEVTLRAPAEFEDMSEIRGTVVAMRQGAPVTIGQIARVLDTYERLTEIERINGVRGIRVAIRKEATANTVEVSRRILEEIREINAAYPHIKVVPVINQGNFIERSIANVARSVFYGGGLAIVVLLLFLRNIRSTIVISLAIPISVIATFAVLFFGGFTLNLMTLGGLALGVGMMVDNSIVVLENIFRRRDQEHEGKYEAAVRGTGEVASAVIASTITTLVIFLPLVFVRGVTGILFQELAFVIVFSLACSLLVSLTLIPMLASRLVESPEELHRRHAGRWAWIGRLSDMSERAFDALNDAYANLLRSVLSARILTCVTAAVLLGASLLLIPLIGTEFLPPSDEGEVRVSGEMEVGTKLELVDRQTRRMEEIVTEAVPEAVAIVAEAQENAEADLRISLLPVAQRTRSNIAVADDLRGRLLGNIPGMEIRVRAPQGQFLLDRILGGSEGIIVEIRGYELGVLDALAERAAERIRDVPGVTDIDISRKAGIPQEELSVNREKAADLGLSVRDVAEALETAVAGTEAGEFRSAGDSHRILVQLQDAEKKSIDEVLDLTLSTSSGEQVALRNVVSTTASRGPIQIDRKDQQRLATVTANIADRDLGSVASDIQAMLAAIPRPAGYEFRLAGNYEEQQEAFQELLLTLAMAVVLVYMVLACQYESLRDPIVVMMSVPMAVIGVLVTLFLTDTTLNIQSYIGCIMLGGIVVNNAILLVDQAGRLRREGMDTRAAVSVAGRRRLRPILMTTTTTILGLLPLALGIGEGADAQAPLARAVVGGLLFSTLVTLVLVPAVYSLIHSDSLMQKAGNVDPAAPAEGGHAH